MGDAAGKAATFRKFESAQQDVDKPNRVSFEADTVRDFIDGLNRALPDDVGKIVMVDHVDLSAERAAGR